MSFNLIEEAKKNLPDSLITTIATTLGEEKEGIQKAISSTLPTLLAGLFTKSANSENSIVGTNLVDIVKKANNSSFLNNLTKPGEGMTATIMNWLKSLFGDKLTTIIHSIAGFANIKTSSANTILTIATPAALAPVGQYAEQHNLNAEGLASFLHSQKSDILSAIPSGFNLAGSLGLSSLGEIGNNFIKNTSAKIGTLENTPKNIGNRWIFPLIVLVAIAALIWIFAQKGCSSNESAAASDTTNTIINPVINNDVVRIEGKLDSTTGDFIYDLGETITLTLPSTNKQLNVGKWSTEAQLFNFLTDEAKTIDTAKGNWFDFTNVRFKTGGATITDDSYTQLKSLAAIIQEFPAARFKIGGYTDNTGDETVNISLSQKRAEAVAAELVKLGVNKSQVAGAEGYGSQFPVGDNTTPEGRAVNRRVSVNVKAKQ